MDDWEVFLAATPVALQTLSVHPHLSVTELLLFYQQICKTVFLSDDLTTLLSNGAQRLGVHLYLEDHWEALEAVVKEEK